MQPAERVPAEELRAAWRGGEAAHLPAVPRSLPLAAGPHRRRQLESC